MGGRKKNIQRFFKKSFHFFCWCHDRYFNASCGGASETTEWRHLRPSFHLLLYKCWDLTSDSIAIISLYPHSLFNLAVACHAGGIKTQKNVQVRKKQHINKYLQLGIKPLKNLKLLELSAAKHLCFRKILDFNIGGICFLFE